MFILLILTSVFIDPAPGYAEAPPTTAFATLKNTGNATVTGIIDPYTLMLNDGRIVHLTGMHVPDLNTPSTDTAGDIATFSVEILRDMLVGEKINLYQSKDKNLGRLNRLGHHLAHVQRASDSGWVQGMLITLGLAQVKTAARIPDMAPQMYALETIARDDQRGLWSLPPYHIASSENAGQYMDRFHIVEGTIHSATLKNNRIYLNFGPDWRQDFTVSIAPGDKRAFSKAGLDPLTWTGLTIRARGWIREYNGPYMEVTHPQAVEILNVVE